MIFQARSQRCHKAIILLRNSLRPAVTGFHSWLVTGRPTQVARERRRATKQRVVPCPSFYLGAIVLQLKLGYLSIQRFPDTLLRHTFCYKKRYFLEESQHRLICTFRCLGVRCTTQAHQTVSLPVHQRAAGSRSLLKRPLSHQVV